MTPAQEVTLDQVRMLGLKLVEAVHAKDRRRADKVLGEMRELVDEKVPHLVVFTLTNQASIELAKQGDPKP